MEKMDNLIMEKNNLYSFVCIIFLMLYISALKRLAVQFNFIDHYGTIGPDQWEVC